MNECIKGSSRTVFMKLLKVSDFSDGFVIYQGHTDSPTKLKAFLKSHLLECLPLHKTKDDNYFFAQQAQGPFTIEFTVTALQNVVRDMAS